MTATAARKVTPVKKNTAPPPPIVEDTDEAPEDEGAIETTTTTVVRKTAVKKELFHGMMLTPAEKMAVRKGHMIPMHSLRSQRVASTSGHVTFFEAKVPRLVPRALVQEAMAKGCAPLDDTDAAFIDDMEHLKTEFEPGLRRAVIMMAMQIIMTENNVTDFTGAGQPKAEVLAERLGFDVHARERQSLWQELQSRNASGDDAIEHPNAESVYKVINAETRDELILIGEHLEIARDHMDGLQNRDLRKLLLSKYTV
jgi:hypothetical protein